MESIQWSGVQKKEFGVIRGPGDIHKTISSSLVNGFQITARINVIYPPWCKPSYVSPVFDQCSATFETMHDWLCSFWKGINKVNPKRILTKFDAALYECRPEWRVQLHTATSLPIAQAQTHRSGGRPCYLWSLSLWDGEETQGAIFASLTNAVRGSIKSNLPHKGHRSQGQRQHHRQEPGTAVTHYGPHSPAGFTGRHVPTTSNQHTVTEG